MGISLLGGLEKAKLQLRATPYIHINGMEMESPIAGEFDVQFNPSTLRLETNAKNYQIKGMMANLHDLPNQVDRSASVVLGVDLIFDAVQNADAFHGDALRVSSQDVISQGASAAKSHTVLPQTNGMIAILAMRMYVVFNWGRQSFSGMITELQAKYLMFSPSGHPIRSKVSIRIQQLIEGNKDMAYWDDAYDNLFTDDVVRASHEKSSLQQQSFINLSGY
ncbi:MAG: hypothetical protein LBQ21_00680 [Clostridiales Family XIII bacterium]|jgi:hypothetical protein|nr:hypothetical protein [Clostridiales Family XIII bacterium]